MPSLKDSIQMNKYAEWLLHSKLGERAIVPCATFDTASFYLHETASQLGEFLLITVDRTHLWIQVTAQGRIDFVGPRIELLQGRVWSYAFPVVGDLSKWRTTARHDFMKKLASRIRAS